MENQPIYFSRLDLLRFFSALMIVVVHANTAYKGTWGFPPFLSIGDGKPSEAGKQVDFFFTNFSLGVEIFFFLSGFLITFLLLSEKQRYNTVNIGKFYLRRILRIWPLYYLIVLFTYVYCQFEQCNPEPYIKPFAFMIGNFGMINSGYWTQAFINPLWSICIEEHFYLFWPLIVAFTPIQRLPLVMFGLIGVSILFRAYLHFYVEWPWMDTYLHTVSRMDTLVIGGLVSYYFYFGKLDLKLPVFVNVVLVVALLSLMCITNFSDYDFLMSRLFKKYVFSALLIMIFLSLFVTRAAVPTGLKMKVMNVIGNISYGMYMYHSIVILILHEKYTEFFRGKSFLLFYALVIVLTIALSIISYYLFERNFLRIKKRFEVVKSKTA